MRSPSIIIGLIMLALIVLVALAGPAVVSQLLFPGERERGVLPEFDVRLDPAYRHRIKCEFAGLPLKGEGEYRFQVQTLDDIGNWDPIFEVPLMIFFHPEE